MAALAIKYALFAAWLASAAYCVISAYLLASFYRRRPASRPAGGMPPPVTVMKPVRGADADSYDNLASFAVQDYPAYQVVFGIADPADPAVEVVKRIMAENPGVDAELVFAGEPIGANLKVSSLHYMAAKARYDVLVIADADMRVDDMYLRAVAAGLDDPSAGLVTCPYRGAYPQDAGAALEALTINTDFLPSVAVAERLEGLSFALGATMAVRREALDAIGGFRALADYLADDYQLGNRVLAAGYGLVLSGYVVDSVGRSESVSGFMGHQLRWGRTYRVSRPGGYLMSGITRLTGISLLCLIASGFSVFGWAVFGAGLSLRYAQALYTELLYVRGPGVARWLWLLPVRDLAGSAIWFLSFTGNRVSWKDAQYTIEKSGKMSRLG